MNDRKKLPDSRGYWVGITDTGKVQGVIMVNSDTYRSHMGDRGHVTELGRADLTYRQLPDRDLLGPVWEDEPKEDGWYQVEGFPGVRKIEYRMDRFWAMKLNGGLWQEVTERVRKIHLVPDPPPKEKEPEWPEEHLCEVKKVQKIGSQYIEREWAIICHAGIIVRNKLYPTERRAGQDGWQFVEGE